jgi:hypothetical protein
MKIVILKLNTSQLDRVNIFEYLSKTYEEKVIVRAFISSLYFDTLLIEVLFL